MTTEEMNVAIYKKMEAEQQHFKEWLLTLPPEQILAHCYEYTVKENILLAMECNDLNVRRAKAFLESPSPLQDAYEIYQKWEVGEVSIAWECIEHCASERLRKEHSVTRKDGILK